MVTCQWPIARVVDTNVGTDNLVRVVTVKTTNRTYKRPVTKVALLLRTMRERRNSELNLYSSYLCLV